MVQQQQQQRVCLLKNLDSFSFTTASSNAEDETSRRTPPSHVFAEVAHIRVVGFYLLYGFVVLLVEENCY